MYRNCLQEVKINEHQCYMNPRVTKGGKCLVGCTNCGGTKNHINVLLQKNICFLIKKLNKKQELILQIK